MSSSRATSLPFPAGSTIALCYGTRPQVIKASVLGRALRQSFNVLAVDTGQHYDYELNALLYEQLEVPRPDRLLEVGSASHDAQTAAVLTRAADYLRETRPAAVAVIGDTNSTLGCALAAVKLRIPVVHVEAGLRGDDPLMAEEINRRAVDSVSSVLCAPSESSTERLRRTSPDAVVANTGDVSRDVLIRATGMLPPFESMASALGLSIEAGRYVFATLHRAELTDDPARLRAAIEALSSLGHPVVFAVHPRTQAALHTAGIGKSELSRLTILPAVGYFQALGLVRNAAAVITDSGGLQREAYWLGVPCITVRNETEWTETLALGANRLLPPRDLDRLGDVFRSAVASRDQWDRNAYGDGHAAKKVAELLLSEG